MTLATSKLAEHTTSARSHGWSNALFKISIMGFQNQFRTVLIRTHFWSQLHTGMHTERYIPKLGLEVLRSDDHHCSMP